jgi:hypothetical protein
MNASGTVLSGGTVGHGSASVRQRTTLFSVMNAGADK